MTSIEKKYFLLANLGPEISRFFSFKDKSPIQAENSKKRIEEIFEEIFILNEDVFFAKMLESLYDYFLRFKDSSKTDVETFFNPIILKYAK